ncbi:MAG: ABC transporter permease [Dehalococcoidia bacterium]|nr:MAG: ABC transporter permease [Dehalococcoidia bacterium]
MSRALRSYLLLLKWQALSQKPILPLSMAVQIMIAIGFVIGLSFFYPELSSTIAKYLITGAPTIIILMIGLVLLPQIVGMARKEGTFDYMWSLPIPRMIYIAADATIWVLVALPGVIISLAIGAAYHGFSLDISLLSIPGLLLITISGVLLGYTIAHGAPKPEIAHLITQVLVFVIMIFSPVMYPVEQLPNWLVQIHNVLPIKYMADLSRGTLTDLDVNLGLAFIVVGAWCAVGFVATYFLIKRRR